MLARRRLRLIERNSLSNEAFYRGGSMKVAFATQDLQRVDAHFGWAKNIAIYELSAEGHRFLEAVQFEGDLQEDGNEDKLARSSKPPRTAPFLRGRHRRSARRAWWPVYPMKVPPEPITDLLTN